MAGFLAVEAAFKPFVVCSRHLVLKNVPCFLSVQKMSRLVISGCSLVLEHADCYASFVLHSSGMIVCEGNALKCFHNYCVNNY